MQKGKGFVMTFYRGRIDETPTIIADSEDDEAMVRQASQEYAEAHGVVIVVEQAPDNATWTEIPGAVYGE